METISSIKAGRVFYCENIGCGSPFIAIKFPSGEFQILDSAATGRGRQGHSPDREVIELCSVDKLANLLKEKVDSL